MIINDLPSLGTDYAFTQLRQNGSSNSGSDSYTTTNAYDYIVVVSNGYTSASTLAPTCSQGTNIYNAYDATTENYMSVRVWESVGSGATVALTTSGRWSWIIIGVNA